jgi:DNA-binding CsgD family transcriptional regulator
MALSSGDETDLLLPLFDQSGAAPFALFLERLRRRTGAAHAGLMLREDDGLVPRTFSAGLDVRGGDGLPPGGQNPDDRVAYDRLRIGRVYSADEFDDHDPARKLRRMRDMPKLGLVDDRVVRLLHEDKVSAWLTLASARPCTAADSALLSALAPYAAAAVRAFVDGERRNRASALDAAGLQRAGAGWIVFDRTARVLATAPATQALLTQALGHAPGARLRELGSQVERALADAAASFADDPAAGDRALVLWPEPRIEAILTRAPPGLGTLLDAPAMVAFCRQMRAPSPARAAHLARLYGLPRREAELAILLADGLSLAEAGARMGLTIETTRNYSKRLFAKLGVRGQPDLVRAVYESCAMLA